MLTRSVQDICNYYNNKQTNDFADAEVKELRECFLLFGTDIHTTMTTLNSNIKIAATTGKISLSLELLLQYTLTMQGHVCNVESVMVLDDSSHEARVYDWGLNKQDRLYSMRRDKQPFI